MGRRADNQSMGVQTEMPSKWALLLGDLMDLTGFRVSVMVEPGEMIATGEFRGARTFKQRGWDWAVLQIAENVKVPICAHGLMQAAWVRDEHEPEREVFAIIDRWGNRRRLIVLEPGQP